jgi:hypothetical protein
LCRNCPLKQVIEGKIERRMEVIGRRGRRHRQLLEELKEMREHFGQWIRNTCKLKMLALEKDGEDKLDRWFEKRRSVTESQGGQEYHTHCKIKEG